MLRELSSKKMLQTEGGFSEHPVDSFADCISFMRGCCGHYMENIDIALLCATAAYYASTPGIEH